MGKVSTRKVYPRVCGGNLVKNKIGVYLTGLSPRVRGKQRYGIRRVLDLGSIPACAGETPVPAASTTYRAVYPRVCGGNPPELVEQIIELGLSPRVRGKRVLAYLPKKYYRSIPACAGETLSTPRSFAKFMVYPRVCGGNTIRNPMPLLADGLSPRVRGKLSTNASVLHNKRSIPACAGETFIFLLTN